MTLRLSPAQIVLACICGLLGAALLYLLLAPLPEYSVAEIRPPAVPADNAPPARFEAPPMEAFAAVDDRSVFNPLRVRVEAPAAPSSAGATSLPSDLTLIGVILDGDTRLALIKSPSHPLAVGVAVGGSIEGWQVSRVDPDKIVLRGGGSEQELKMSFSKLTPTQFPLQAQPQIQAPAQAQAAQDSSDND